MNRAEEAVPLFESFLGETDDFPQVFVYLSVAYYQIGEFQKAIDIAEEGLKKEEPKENEKVLLFNAGNAAYALGNYVKADYYYDASLKSDENYAPATLNRANTQLRRDQLPEARANYVRYLELKPETPQRPEIEKMIRLLDEEIAFRAKNGPELVESFGSRSDDGSGGKTEAMSDAEVAAPALPVAEKIDDGEILGSDSSVAPALPRESRSISGERVGGGSETAPALPRESRSSSGERVGGSAPEVPEEKKEEVKSERISAPTPPNVEEEKNQEEPVPETPYIDAK